MQTGCLHSHLQNVVARELVLLKPCAWAAAAREKGLLGVGLNIMEAS